MSTGRSIDWSRTARSLENHHLRSRPTQRRNGRPLRFRWADERANLRHIYSTMSGPDARSPRYRHHGQSCGSQGHWRAPGNRSGGRVPAISAAVFAGFQSDRTGLQQSEIEAAQGRRAHSQRTLSQNRLDFPLLQNSRMWKFLQACGVRVNVSGICSGGGASAALRGGGPWRAVRARQQRAALILREPPSSFGGWIVPRAGANGRGGELGIIEGFMGAAPEPDIANYNWIAGHDLAFVGRAIADHPI